MNAQTHLAIDGYVDAIPTPGTGWGTARFDLIHSPTGPDTPAPGAPDTVYACTTADPRIADVLLREIRTGDLLRVTGTVVQPDDSTTPARVSVDSLEVLEAAPASVLYELLLERFGNYVVVFDIDRDQVRVFTASGHWVGEAANPDAISDLINAYEEGDTR